MFPSYGPHYLGSMVVFFFCFIILVFSLIRLWRIFPAPKGGSTPFRQTVKAVKTEWVNGGVRNGTWVAPPMLGSALNESSIACRVCLWNGFFGFDVATQKIFRFHCPNLISEAKCSNNFGWTSTGAEFHRQGYRIGG